MFCTRVPDIEGFGAGLRKGDADQTNILVSLLLPTVNRAATGVGTSMD